MNLDDLKSTMSKWNNPSGKNEENIENSICFLIQI